MFQTASLLSNRFVRLAFLVLLFGYALPVRAVVAPTPFTPNAPLNGSAIGWSYAGNKFVGTILGDGIKKLYSTDLTGGSVTSFGTYIGGAPVVLNPTHFGEHFVSSSLGLGGFPNRDIYVASGNNIQHITNAGIADNGLFLTNGLQGDVRGITFDAVGTFNNQMIITTDQGYVYKVNSAGVPTQIAYTGEDTEGLDIAPIASTPIWGSLAGSLFVASEGSGMIRAIDPITSAITLVAQTPFGIPSAEQLNFVPMDLGASGNPLEGLYSASYDGNSNNSNVVFAPASQFAGLQGHIILTGELSRDIYDLSGINTWATVGTFPNGVYPNNGQPEDGLFVTTTVLLGADAPEPASLGLMSVSGMILLVRRRWA